jgi:NTE family protein
MRATVHLLRVLGEIAVLMLGACSSLSVPMNEPLRSAAGNTEFRLLDVNRLGGAESALVLVALSGGGKRSAAFGHGVLRGMRDIHVRPEAKDSTLLAEVDLLAGVSGGSFPAAHFGLYGAKSFETFPTSSFIRTSRRMSGAPSCCRGIGTGYSIPWWAPTTG